MARILNFFLVVTYSIKVHQLTPFTLERFLWHKQISRYVVQREKKIDVLLFASLKRADERDEFSLEVERFRHPLHGVLAGSTEVPGANHGEQVFDGDYSLVRKLVDAFLRRCPRQLTFVLGKKWEGGNNSQMQVRERKRTVWILLMIWKTLQRWSFQVMTVYTSMK